MKKLTTTAIILTLFATSPTAFADGQLSVSGNAGLATDYPFRGISQTDEELAVQAGIDLTHDSGFYLGAWGSNVEFFDSTQAELDFYGGFSGGTSKGLGWDVGTIFYDYPGEPGGANYEFWEMCGGLGYGFGGPAEPTAGLSLNYSPDYFAASGDAWYWQSTLDLNLPRGFGLGIAYGYQMIDDNAAFGTPDYSDWSVAVSRSMIGLDFSLTYFDTDLDGTDCFGGPDEICDARVVLSVGVSL